MSNDKKRPAVEITKNNEVIIRVKKGYCCAECDHDAPEEDRKDCFPLCRRCYDRDGE